MSNLKNFLGIKDIYKYGGINTYDVAKFLAIFFMIIDHLGYFIFIEDAYLRGLGRLAFPIFFFLIGHSQDSKASWNLLIIGLVVSVYKGLVAGIWLPFDILLTAFLSKIILKFFIRKDMLGGAKLITSYFVIMIWHLFMVIVFSYGAYGVLYAIAGYLKREENNGNPHKYLNIYLLITIISDYMLQRFFWPDADAFMQIFAVVYVFLVYYLMSFEIKNITAIKNKVASSVILFFSRNSLFIYWLHCVALLTISVMLFPERYAI